MIQLITLRPGVTLRCVRDTRFKHSCLSIQFVRPTVREEAPLSALVPEILLRGTASAPDLRAITQRLDDLYGASVGPLVRRVGDYQTTGFFCSFISDRFAMDGDQILAPLVSFLQQLLLEPVTENGCFRREFVAGEKKNLIATIESRKNDKRAYTNSQMLKKMCGADPMGIPRLGEAEQVQTITPEAAWEYYGRLLRTSPLSLFYVGDAEPQDIAAALQPLVDRLERDCLELPPQPPYRHSPEGDYTETMEVSQGKLSMGFVAPVTIRDPGFAAMQVCNVLFGGGMTSLLFTNIREKLSLCYDIGSSYNGSKGIVTVSAGIDCDKYELVRQEILDQLALCRKGEFTEEQLNAAKQAVISSLRGVHDSPGSIENYYASAALSGLPMTPAQYMTAVEQVTAQQVVEAAKGLTLHTCYFLKGGAADAHV